MNQLISIVVPCYNQGQFLDEAIDSVLSQTYKNIEIIVVNDGSTDSFTNDLLTNYSRPNTKVITTENQGLAKARNTAIDAANGEFVLPLDADDKIAPTYCEKAIDIISKNENIGIVHSKTEYFGERSGLRYDPPFSLEAILRKNVILCSSIFRRADWEKVGGYNANMKYGGEDWDFWLSILELGKEVYKISEVMFYYRIRGKSMARSIDEGKFRELRKQIYLNHLQLYLDNFPDPITLYWDFDNYRVKYYRLVNSKGYQITKSVLSPFAKVIKYLR